MILWQMLCNRKAILIHKKKAMAVFVNLHLITSTDPITSLGFFNSL